jgi:putative sterol carrier protein
VTIHFVEDAETWIEAWRTLLEESPNFEAAAAGWGVEFDGSILLSVEDAPGVDPPSFYVEPHDGGIREARVVEGPVEAGFALSAPLSVWQDLVRGEIAPTAAVTGGDVAFDGNPMVAMQYSEALEIMIAAASAIDTEFPEW